MRININTICEKSACHYTRWYAQSLK